jgi:SAM-dependent methyltransferase
MSYSPHLQRVRTFPDAAAALRFFRRNYDALLRDLPEGPILDIGCGLGDFLVYCRDSLRREAVGIDLDAENVRLCQELGLAASVAEASAFLQQERQYAAIVMNDVIEHVSKPDVIPLLSLIHRRLLAGGKVLLKTPNMSNPLTAARNFHLDFTHQIGFTEESMTYVLEQGGFSDLGAFPVDIYVTSSAVANAVGRVGNCLLHGIWRLLYGLQGVPRVQVLTKGLIGCGVKRP